MSIDVSRRHLLAVVSSAGFGATLFPGTLLGLAASAAAQAPGAVPATDKLLPITDAMIEQAAVIAGVAFTPEQRKMMLDGLASQRESISDIRKLALPNAVAPALIFDPVPSGTKLNTTKLPPKLDLLSHVHAEVDTHSESAGENLAYLNLRELGELIHTHKITSVQLTRMYMGRLRRLDKQLHCVVTMLDERAERQAATADQDLASGKYHGPLHGIPWGAKDLLAIAGYPTTWGAAGFEKQQFDTDAIVAQRLEAAGAVLIAKLSMGALAQGDLWFGGRTRNPWNTAQGSSGSSAGSASAVSAGCVGFAIGTETLGSISSPSTRCGVTGLRPSFGLVPRTGAMALSWSMDKIGPIARTVEDAAIVLSAIYGPDGHDLSVRDAAFNLDFTTDVRTLRVGYLKSQFEPVFTPLKPPSETLSGKALDEYNGRVARNKAAWERQKYDATYNAKTLEVLLSMGIKLIPKEIPKYPYGSIVPMLEAEAAAAFDELTRSGRDTLLTGQSPSDWPNQFRIARLYPAVDYIQAARARTGALALMTKLFSDVDVIVTPSSGVQLTATNLTGQPAVIVPNGFRGPDAPLPPSTEDGSSMNVGGPGTPVSITFLAPLYQDAKACALAHAYQKKTGFHLEHPKL